MNWYKQSKFSTPTDEYRDSCEKALGLGKHTLKNFSTKKKKKLKRNCEPLHSLDIHCDGVDDGY
jgi:hypothetical protein